MPEVIQINGEEIRPGEDKQVHISIARLPTYTNIDLSVRVIRAEQDGPVVLLSGGLHGDEINGIEIVRRLISKDHLQLTAGTIIAVPLMNVYGFIQNVRGVPDGKDINRSFPGTKNGSLAMLVAHTIVKEIIPIIDYGIDFHTGGASRANYPQIRCVFDLKDDLKLAKAFAPPVILHSGLIDKSFRKAASKKGKQILVYETGESMRFDEDGIAIAIRGTQRFLHHMKMRKSSPQPLIKPAIYRKSNWIRAKYAGIFNPKVKLGDVIKPRQILGKITDPYGNESFNISARLDGRVIGLNNSPVVHKGDAVMHIATNELIEVK
ncbi:succinylglutamate desuccinylase [Rhodohalobacter sp. SW132]|uniref:succinylglutamate desuccinylase/aspartoacylase family protein n=1 Tax=Rhodohalobacter sp. SW132 TaxID=2293433 RepID=UPI000E26810C|nr:succinylglutamate desuccinylase/aspartoacylase family protein [Rhodohalobacter sp. SW132]REL38198.1 succinylglutamate desuccinylase [Rhodohalobacter sp. SW132]